MKAISLKFAGLAAPLIGCLAAFYGCAPDDPTATNGGGAAGTATTGGTVSGGTGGTPGTGGSTAGAAGTVMTGGGGSGGATGGVGGAVGGVGGALGGGGAGGAVATDPCDPGGDVNACIDKVAGGMSDFGNPGWKDSWWITGCLQKANHDCITNANTCNANDDPNNPEAQGARTKETFMIGGMPGQHYKVTFQFNAVTEAKYYQGGKRDVPTVVGDPHTNTPLDMFYRDGTIPVSHYNVVKLTVYDDKMMPARHFFMNSAPDNGATWENHYTFLASYKKSIVIVGGGKIEHLVEDSNCHAIDNCGPEYHDTADCAGSRKLPGTDGNAMLPAKYMDPVDGKVKDLSQLVPAYNGMVTQPFHAQAGHLTVTAIEKTNDPVTMDYP